MKSKIKRILSILAIVILTTGIGYVAYQSSLKSESEISVDETVIDEDTVEETKNLIDTVSENLEKTKEQYRQLG